MCVRAFRPLPLRLQTKTPMTLGQKKAKAIDQLLDELGVGESQFYTKFRNETLGSWVQKLQKVKLTSVVGTVYTWQPQFSLVGTCHLMGD